MTDKLRLADELNPVAGEIVGVRLSEEIKQAVEMHRHYDMASRAGELVYFSKRVAELEDQIDIYDAIKDVSLTRDSERILELEETVRYLIKLKYCKMCGTTFATVEAEEAK